MRLSIRSLLTIWYAGVAAIIVLVLGVGVYFSASWSLDHAIHSDLTSGIDGVTTFLRHKYATRDIKHLGDELREHSSLLPKGKFSRISFADGSLLFQDSSMLSLPTLPASSNGTYSKRDTLIGEKSIRYFSRVVSAGPDHFLVEIGVDHSAYVDLARRLAWLLALSIPAAAILAALGGYWMSGRVLDPIHRISRTASRIDAQNLKLRLPLRGTDDELDQLSTTLNSMFDRIENAYQRVTRFTSDASHELRTPVALIRSNAELLLMSPDDPPRISRGLNDILKESEYMTQLIGDLLTLARTDRLHDSHIKELFELGEAFAEVVSRAEALAATRAIHVVHRSAHHVVAIRGHRSEFQRLAMIFIDNAILYSPPGSTISLTTWTTASTCGFTVADSGVGIAPEALPHIFERFYRVDQSRTPRDASTGLGLAIAKGLVITHGGDITVQSQSGQGSTFNISLPRADTEESAPDPSPASAVSIPTPIMKSR